MANKAYKPKQAGYVRKIRAYTFHHALALNLTVHDGKSGYALTDTIYLSAEGVQALKAVITAWESERGDMRETCIDLEPRD